MAMSEAGLRSIAALHNAATVASAPGKIVAGCWSVSWRTARCMARGVKSSAMGLRPNTGESGERSMLRKRSHHTLATLKRVLFEEDEFDPGKPIAIGALGFTRFPRQGLRRSPPFDMKSVRINRMHGNEILRNNLRSQT